MKYLAYEVFAEYACETGHKGLLLTSASWATSASLIGGLLMTAVSSDELSVDPNWYRLRTSLMACGLQLAH